MFGIERLCVFAFSLGGALRTMAPWAIFLSFVMVRIPIILVFCRLAHHQLNLENLLLSMPYIQMVSRQPELDFIN